MSKPDDVLTKASGDDNSGERTAAIVELTRVLGAPNVVVDDAGAERGDIDAQPATKSNRATARAHPPMRAM